MRKFSYIMFFILPWILSFECCGQSMGPSSKPIDVVLGKEGALTVVVYDSLSCAGCAYFAQKILPDIEKEYVQTGKIRLVFRQMVMHPNDISAAMLVCCASNPHKLQLEYWKQQHEWVGASDDRAVRKIAENNGMTPNQIERCLGDKQLRQNLFTKKFVALKAYNIKAIPTIFINNKEYPDIQTTGDLRKAIEEGLKEAHNKK